MKRALAWISALICITTLLVGCGASTGSGAAMNASPSAAAETTEAAKGNYGGMEFFNSDSAADADRADTGRTDEAKRIYTADLNMETTAFDDAAKGLTALVGELGGWMQSSGVDYGGSGYRRGNYTVRVPQEKFDAFLTRAGELCHVTYSYTNVEDVSEYYYDTAGRLSTQQTKLERLQTLLSKAESMEDIITIESAISDTEQQIESLSGELKHYDSQIDYATVNISLNEVYQLSNVEQPATGFASRIGAALSSGAHGFVTFLQSVLVFLAYAWVWVLLIAAALAGAIYIRRKRRALPKTGQKPQAEKKDDKTE